MGGVGLIKCGGCWINRVFMGCVVFITQCNRHTLYLSRTDNIKQSSQVDIQYGVCVCLCLSVSVCVLICVHVCLYVFVHFAPSLCERETHELVVKVIDDGCLSGTVSDLCQLGV